MGAAATHTIRGGVLDGRPLRIRRGRLEVCDGEPASWFYSAPLTRSLAKFYPVDSELWDWLRSHGITRPQPSGRSLSRAERTRRKIELTLSDAARARLDAIATETGESRSAVVEQLVMGVR